VIEAKVKKQRTADQLGRQSGHECLRITSSTDRRAKVGGDWAIDYGLAVGTPTVSTPQESGPFNSNGMIGERPDRGLDQMNGAWPTRGKGAELLLYPA
jgi:hypothetical protein